MQNIYIDIVATFDALPFRQGRVPTPCHFDKAECQPVLDPLSDKAECQCSVNLSA